MKGWLRRSTGVAGERWVGGVGLSRLAIAVPYEHTEVESIDWMWRKALEGLSEFERRPAAEIESDILTATTDVLRVRLHGSGVKDGELKLANVPEVYQGVERLLRAAAKSENARPGQKPAGATKALLDEALLLPAAPGSVILSIVGPQLTRGDGDALTFDGLGGTKAAYERRVFERVLTGCVAARTAVDRTLDGTLTNAGFDEDPLEQERKAGLTPDLCVALRELAGTESGLHADLEVAVGWAVVGNTSVVPSQVSFERHAVSALETVHEILVRRSGYENTTVTGRIEKARRPSPASFGEVTVVAEFSGMEANLTFSLRDETEFGQAVDALKAGGPNQVDFTASLSKQRRGWKVVSHGPLSFSRRES